MSHGFWVGVAQTAIGSGLGFGLGILAFHYQQRRQGAKEEADRWRSTLDALNRLMAAAGANIEALANTKIQILSALRPELEGMKTALAAYHEAPSEQRQQRIENLMTAASDMRAFYMTVPRTMTMLPPEPTEISSLSAEMPALTMFVHRAVGMMHELNDIAGMRNQLIAEQARESGNGEGVKERRFIYFVTMLTGQAEALCEYADFSLDFWRLVREQVRAYMTTKGAGQPFLDYKLVPAAEAALPAEELFPLAKAQLVTFDG